jgi:hypothetical protein
MAERRRFAVLDEKTGAWRAPASRVSTKVLKRASSLQTIRYDSTRETRVKGSLEVPHTERNLDELQINF